jgi:hypothetical protein
VQRPKKSAKRSSTGSVMGFGRGRGLMISALEEAKDAVYRLWVDSLKQIKFKVLLYV